jgi:hypothetical protein
MKDAQTAKATPTITDEILESFYVKLRESDELDEDIVQELRSLLGPGKKSATADLVAVFERRNRETAS